LEPAKEFGLIYESAVYISLSHEALKNCDGQMGLSHSAIPDKEETSVNIGKAVHEID
jgi:hypothetical protein